MNLYILDWIIIAAFFVLIITIGIIYSRRAGKSTGDFFLTGRNLPWYIAGTSMVATTFAADTPLAVTELVAENGIAGNWLWWNMVFGGMLTVFFFARLWRRSGIITDCEFVSIRYSGKPAVFLRGFRAIYIGLFMNVIVMGWVSLAMVKILRVFFPELSFFGYEGFSIIGFEFSPYLLWVGLIMVFIAIYSSLSGLWGISITDTIQFVIAMTGCIALAFFALKHPDVGGMSGLKEKLPDAVFSFFPTLGDGSESLFTLGVVSFITYMAVQWWSSWYPGAEPGGGGYVAQRIMSAKDERHSLFATLWFQIAHFAIRPWPWIIVALVTLVLYPDLPAESKGDGFVMVIRDVLPIGWTGLLVAAFFAAFMSTIASQTVWGISYIVNDLYRPILKPKRSEKYYVNVSRVATFILLFISLIVTSRLDRISDAWKFILECSAGIGPVLILRWFWWRINSWSEISALIAPFIIYPLLIHLGVGFPYSLLIIVVWSSLIWVPVTFLTKPESNKTLSDFYRKIHPGGPGWKHIAAQNKDVDADKGFARLFIAWIFGCLLVIGILFGIGKLILSEYLMAVIYFGFSALSVYMIYKQLSKIGWEKVVK